MVAALALLLTGCTSAVSGPSPATPVSTAPPPPAPLTAQQALGDLTTVDYCSLLDLTKIADGGAVAAGPATPSLGYCSADAVLGKHDIEILVGDLAGKEADSDRIPDVARTLGAGLQVQMVVDSDPDSCVRYLTFADGTHLVARVDNATEVRSDADQPGSLCGVDDGVLDGLISGVQAKKVGHLSFPPGSLGAADPCAVVEGPEVTQFLGDAVHSVAMPGRHRCLWQSDDEHTSADVRFEYGVLPGASNAKIAGHTARISKPADPSCEIVTDLGPSPASGQHEIAELYVFLSRGDKDPCTAATSITNADWPKLPKR
jgi:hypothetical protein